MSTLPRENVRPGRSRRLLLSMVIVLGAVTGTLVAPAPAAADFHWIIPPGGWCYNDWYVFGSSYGSQHQAYGPTKHFINNTSSSANWSESIQVNTTFTSTYNYSASYQGGFNLWIVKSTVEFQLQITTTNTIQVNKTTGFQITVPPHTTMYAEYGSFGVSSDGTYYQEQYECGTGNYSSVTSGGVDAYNLTSEGWTLWEA